MQKKSIISKGKYSFAQAENMVSVRQYFFVRDEKGQKRLLLRFFNDRHEICTGFAFVIRFLDSRGKVIDEEEYESGRISAAPSSPAYFEEAIFVDERCVNFKVDVLYARYDNYKYVNDSGTVSVEYDNSSQEELPAKGTSKIKAPRKIKTRFFKLPMLYVWLALSILTLAVIVMSVQLLIFKMTNDRFSIDGIEYEFVSGDKKTGDVVITGHSGNHSNLLIPAEIEGHRVVGINDYAFKNNTKIKKVRIEGVDIGYRAFYGCKNLSEVQIASVTEIGADAFRACSKLLRVSVTGDDETDVLEIGRGAFADCNVLADVSIDQLAYYQSRYAIFENDYNIRNLHLKNFAYELEGYDSSNQAKKIDELFYGESYIYTDSKLTSLSIDYIDEIVSGFCSDYEYLKSFTIKETTVPTIESYAFYDCTSLAQVNFKAPVSKVEGYAFANTAIKSFNGTELSQIGENAFYSCTSLAQFNLSGNDTLIKIGDDAFRDCLSLKKIVLPSSLTKICAGAFAGSGLESFTFSSTATEIENGILSECSNVEELNLAYIPNGYIGYMFGYFANELSDNAYELETIRKVKIYGEKETLDSNAFAYCSGLQTVSLANAVTDIGSRAFYDCRSLAGINLGDSIETIGESAFYNCRALSIINLGQNVSSIGDYAFENSGLESIVIPPNATVGQGILSGCNRLEEATLPLDNIQMSNYFSSGWELNNAPRSLRVINVNHAEIICAYAFEGCYGVEEINLCEGITVILDYAFSSCEQLRKLVLPSTLQDFAYTSVANCYKLYEICNQSSAIEMVASSFELPYTLEVSTSLDQMAPTVKIDDCYFAKYQNEWYLVNWEKDTAKLSPKESFTYKGASATESVYEWSIPHYLFYQDDSGIEEFEIPSSVTRIGDCAFKECKNSMSVEFDENTNLTSIGKECFAYASYLKSVALPTGIEIIDDYAFADCYDLTSIEMPSALEKIGSHAFDSCVSLKSIVLPRNLKSIEYDSFEDCTNLYDIYNLSSIQISEGSDEYSSVARYGFVHTSLDAPMSTVITIYGVGEFRNSGSKWLLLSLDHSLKTFDTTKLNYDNKLFDSIRILENAARGRDELQSVILGGNVIQIQNGAFDECYNLRTVHMSNARVAKIEDNSFRNCSRIYELELPTMLKEIGNDAFLGCAKLLSVRLPNNLEKIGDGAFYGCCELFEVYDFSDIPVYYDESNGYVGYYAKLIITSNYTSPLPRKVENGMYFVFADGNYYLHHIEDASKIKGIFEIPDVGSNIIITPDAFCGLFSEGVIMPKSVAQIDFTGNENCLQTVYYYGNYNDWNAINILGNGTAFVLYYSNCVHEYSAWTYANGKVSTEYCSLEWSVDVEPTCNSSGLRVGRCACKNGCQYKEEYNISTVEHKFQNDICIYCQRKLETITSQNLDKYNTQIDISLQGFEIDENGKAVPHNVQLGMQGVVEITARVDTLIKFKVTQSSYNDIIYLYENYGYGYILADEIRDACKDKEITISLSEGESFKIVFVNYTKHQDENAETESMYLSDIKFLLR